MRDRERYFIITLLTTAILCLIIAVAGLISSA